LAPAPARKYRDQRAEQPVVTENRRLTRPPGSTTLGLVRLNFLSVAGQCRALLATTIPVRAAPTPASSTAASHPSTLEGNVAEVMDSSGRCLAVELAGAPYRRSPGNSRESARPVERLVGQHGDESIGPVRSSQDTTRSLNHLVGSQQQ
jgi:hypothetical protein